MNEIREKIRQIYEETGEMPLELTVSEAEYDLLSAEIEQMCVWPLSCEQMVAPLVIDGVIIKWSR